MDIGFIGIGKMGSPMARRLLVDLGRENGVPLPLGTAVQKNLRDAMDADMADKGVNAVMLPLEQAAGIKVRT